MPKKIIHHIHVNANEEARVTTTPPDQELNPGDQVEFKSNDTRTEIKYRVYPSGTTPPAHTQRGSPFPSQLAAGQRYKVSTGTTFTIENKCSNDSHFHFDCGHDVEDRFEEWADPPRHKAAGNTGGPDE